MMILSKLGKLQETIIEPLIHIFMGMYMMTFKDLFD